MSNSKWIAGLMGPVLVAAALSFQFNGELWTSIIDEPGPELASVVVVTGLLLLVTGIAIVRSHPYWTGGWRVLITVLGWFAILAGVLRTVLPGRVVGIGHSLFQGPGSMFPFIVIYGLIGLFLTYQGYSRDDKNA